MAGVSVGFRDRVRIQQRDDESIRTRLELTPLILVALVHMTAHFCHGTDIMRVPLMNAQSQGTI